VLDLDKLGLPKILRFADQTSLHVLYMSYLPQMPEVQVHSLYTLYQFVTLVGFMVSCTVFMDNLSAMNLVMKGWAPEQAWTIS